MYFDGDKYISVPTFFVSTPVYKENDTLPECRDNGQGPRQAISCQIKCISITVPHNRSSNVVFFIIMPPT